MSDTKGTANTPVTKKGACDRCRKRKSKCEPISGAQCKSCLKANLECTFSPPIPSKKRQKKKKPLVWKNMTIDGSSTGTAMNTLSEDTDSRTSELMSPLSPSISLSTSPSTNTTTTSQSGRNYCSFKLSRYSDLPENVIDDLNDLQCSLTFEDLPDLSTEKAEEAHDYFFKELYYISEILFRPKYIANYKKGLMITKPLTYSIWAVVLLIKGEHEKADQYYFKSESLLLKLMECPKTGMKSYNSISSCQTLCILSDFEIRRGKTMKCPLTLAKAIRQCQLREYDTLDLRHPFGLGSNEENNDSFIEETEAYPSWALDEEIRRTFFKIYCFDKYLALGKNLKPFLDPFGIHTRLPSITNLELFFNTDAQHIPKTIPYKKAGTPFIMEGLESIKRGEILYNVSPYGIHVILLTVVNEVLEWVSQICSPLCNCNESTLNTVVIKLNEFYLKLDFMNNSFNGYSWDNLNFNEVTVNITKIRMLQSIILLFTNILRDKPETYTENMDAIYLEIQYKCMMSTMELTQVLQGCDELAVLLTKNPFYYMAIHQSIKSSIQLGIISNQPNCSHVDKSLTSGLFSELGKIISVFEEMKLKAHLVKHLIYFYNSKLKTYEENPYDFIYFQDYLGV